jgi:DNA-binding transcriptional LysR family regulator
MELLQLEHFLAVAEEGSFTRAAALTHRAALRAVRASSRRATID